jgi:hypothetical protein
MVNQQESIGMATMTEDKTIILDLRATGDNGEVGTGRVTYSLSDPQYNDILKHLGGLKIGEKKPVPPWKDN